MTKLTFQRKNLSLYEFFSLVTRNDKNSFNIDTTINVTQKSKVIEAVLLNIQLGVVFLFESDEKYQTITKYYVFKTIFDFLDNKFELCDLEILTELNGLSIKNMEQYYIRMIQDTNVDVVIYQEDETIKNYKQKLQNIIYGVK